MIICVICKDLKNKATTLSIAGKKNMQFVVGIATSSTSGSGGMRPLLLILLVVAVVLILMGCGIALLSLKNQRKDQVAFITVENPNSRTETS